MPESPASHSPTPDPRIASLAHEVATLEESLRSGRWVRIGLLLLLVAFTLGLSWRFVTLARQLQSDENVQALVKAGEQRFEQRLPLVRKELQTLVDESSPVVTKAFYAQAKADLPKFLAAMQTQREPLVANLKTRLEERLNRAYNLAAQEQIKLIRETVPEAEDPVVQDRVEKHFEQMFARLIEKYYIGQLEGQMEVMFQLWDEFPAEQRGPNDPPLPDLLIGHLLEVASAKLATTDGRPAVAPGIPEQAPTSNTEFAPAESKKPTPAAAPTGAAQCGAAQSGATQSGSTKSSAPAVSESDPGPPEPAESAAQPNEDPAQPNEDPAKPNEDPAKPNEDPAKPNEDPAKPAETSATPGE